MDVDDLCVRIFFFFKNVFIVQIHDYTLHNITCMHDPRQHTNIEYTITFEIHYFTIHYFFSDIICHLSTYLVSKFDSCCSIL